MICPMPRIPPYLIIQAYQRNPFLPLLLQECRSLDSAMNELRWLCEHAFSISTSVFGGQHVQPNCTSAQWRSRLRSMCRKRSRGIPLQYILGDQPFGDLEILCRKGVLIPRPETEYFTLRTAKLILDVAHGSRSMTDPLHILDLCTGTGCISLLLHALLAPYFSQMFILGVDFSANAIRLAKRNLQHNLRLGLLTGRSISEIQFRQGDVLGRQGNDVPGVEEVLSDYLSSPACLTKLNSPSQQKYQCDVLISNPPYISPASFRDGTTARSVRIFEPELALVPPAAEHGSTTEVCLREDLFYHHLLSLSFQLSAKITILECGDRLQAKRVATLCKTIADKEQRADEMIVETWHTDDSDHAIDFSMGNGPWAVVLRQRQS